MVIAPSNPSIVYAVTTDEMLPMSEIFVSLDGGQNWYATSFGLTKSVVDDIAVDPLTPNVLYTAGSGGVYQSTDGGGLWTARNTGLPPYSAEPPTTPSATTLAIDPKKPSTLYAGVEGVRNQEGLYKSTDAGMTWAKVGDVVSPDILIVDPTISATLYAAYGTVGLLKSVDGGEQWKTVLDSNVLLVEAMALDPVTHSTIYAAGIVPVPDGSIKSGVMKSLDGGETWGAISEIPKSYIDTLAIDPTSPNIVYAGSVEGSGNDNATMGGVFVSTDGARTWHPSTKGLTNETILDLTVDPMTPNRLFAATRSGVMKSTDGGGNWQAVNRGLAGTHVTALQIVRGTPAVLYAASDRDGVWKSTDGGGSWVSKSKGLPKGVVSALAADPNRPATLYAGTTESGVYKTTDGGGSWQAVNNGIIDKEMYTIAVDPKNTSVVYAGTIKGSVYKSLDGGGSWRNIFDLLPLEPIDIAIARLAIDPKNPSILYAATEGCGIAKTIDGGAHWAYANGDLPGCRAYSMAIDPITPSTLYVWIYPACKYGMGLQGGLVKSTDGGDHWEVIGAGIEDERVNALAVDPTNPVGLYAGTYNGVFASTDGGRHWFPINNGLLHFSITDLAMDPTTPKKVYAATEGGGVFVADVEE